MMGVVGGGFEAQLDPFVGGFGVSAGRSTAAGMNVRKEHAVAIPVRGCCACLRLIKTRAIRIRQE